MNALTFDTCRLRSALWGAVVGGFLLASASTALAFFQPGPPGTDPNFEIDEPANALDNELYPGDDWETIYRCFGSPASPLCTALGGLNANLIATTGILNDPAPATIFWKGGSKDTNDVSQWWYKEGSVPDKDQILHAGAAAYDVGGELVMYIFADRYANDGDALLGAWFFQNEVTLNPDPDNPTQGTFNGVHKNGDVVWFGEFSGGGVVTTLRVAKWNDTALADPDPACFQNSEPNVPYQIGNSKLCVIAEGSGGTGTGYFASVNTGDESSPWPYRPKQGTAEYFPYNSFMEGGINLTALLGTTPCFSSFLIESRSSTSETAVLKDFVLGSINTCKIGVDKLCTAELGADGASIVNHFTIKARNEGFATITSVSLTDDHYPSADHTWTWNTPIAPADGWVTVGQYDFTSTSQGTTNEVTAIGHAGSYETAPATDTVTCPNVPVAPGLAITKDCDKTQLVVDDMGTSTTSDDRLWVKLFYKGTVCNTGDVRITGVSATDTHNGATSALALTFPGATGVLNPSACASFSASYFPNMPVGTGVTEVYSVSRECYVRDTNQLWTDTVNASGTAALGGGTVNAIADPATCPLCPNCEPLP